MDNKEKEKEKEYKTALMNLEESGVKCERFGCSVSFQEPDVNKIDIYMAKMESPDKRLMNKLEKKYIDPIYKNARDIANDVLEYYLSKKKKN